MSIISKNQNFPEFEEVLAHICFHLDYLCLFKLFIFCVRPCVCGYFCDDASCACVSCDDGDDHRDLSFRLCISCHSNSSENFPDIEAPNPIRRSRHAPYSTTLADWSIRDDWLRPLSVTALPPLQVLAKVPGCRILLLS
jgi:hypothetical protein